MKLVVEMLNLVIDWLDTGCEENWEMKVNFQVLGLSNWLNGGIFQWDQNPEGRSGWELKKGQRRSSQFSVWHILRFKCLWHMFLEIFISQSYMQVWGEKREVQIWKVFNLKMINKPWRWLRPVRGIYRARRVMVFFFLSFNIYLLDCTRTKNIPTTAQLNLSHRLAR